MSCQLLMFLMMVIHSMEIIKCEEYCIVPFKNDSSSENSCFTLSQFADNFTRFQKLNTTLIFIGGKHTLDVEISVSNVEEFSMISMNRVDDSDQAIIDCGQHAKFTFSNMSYVYINGLTLTGCDDNKVKFVDQLIVTHSKIIGKTNNATGLMIVESIVNMSSTSFLSNAVSRDQSDAQCLSTTSNNGRVLGGALRVVHSTLAVDNCHFEGNVARIGGAIFSELGSSITINSSTFSSNHAMGCVNEQCSSYGGAIRVNGSTVDIYNSTFQNNTSAGDGGMAAVFNSTFILSQSNVSNNSAGRCGGVMAAFRHSIIIMRAATFSCNQASQDGGAVYLCKSKASVSICNFVQNVANNSGGAIASTITDSIMLYQNTFSFNSAKLGGVLSAQRHSSMIIENSTMLCNNASSDGGVIHASFSTVTISNSTIIENVATGFGGVLYIKTSFVHIEGSCIHKTTADRDGGVIYATNGTVCMRGNHFLSNLGRENGGVLFLTDSSTAIIHQSFFDKNRVKYGGGVISIRNPGSSAVINGSNFSSNTAKEFGGIAHLRNGSYVHITDSVFDKNFAGRGGGVINGYQMTSINISRSTFLNNKAIGGGGVVTVMLGSTFIAKTCEFHENVNSDLGAVIQAVNGTTTIIHDSHFSHNLANFGGILSAIRNNIITIYNTTFSNNTARLNGGTLYTRTLCNIMVVNCSFINNTAVSDGVIVVSDQSNSTVINSTFRDNIAGHDGGVVYVYNNGILIFNNCFLTSNYASNSGGAVYGLKGSKIMINKSRIHKNKAQHSGGALHAQQDSSIFVEASNFTSNIADYGGAMRVYVWSSAYINGSMLNENRAEISGGAMAAFESSNITVQESNFTSNIATFGGVSVIFQNNYPRFEGNRSLTNMIKFGREIRKFQRSAIAIVGSRFCQNKADIGGVLYTRGGKATIETSTLDYNSAKYDGGSIYAYGESSVIVGSTNFTENVANDNGGAIALIGDSVVRIRDSGFTRNRAHDDGGVLNLQQSNASICRGTFNLSTAGRLGGVIHVTNGTVQVNESLFINNTVTYSGGVVATSSSSKLNILCSNFSNNTASDSGGVVFQEHHSKSSIVDSFFRQNKAERNGGAVSASSSSDLNVTSSVFIQNTARLGGALSIVQNSTVSFYLGGTNGSQSNYSKNGEIRVCNNKAARSGGGINLRNSHLFLGMDTKINDNEASELGGGVYAVNSSITVKSMVTFYNNEGMNGGGISLENSKLYDVIDEDMVFAINFVSNQAMYGGAIYYRDDKAQGYVCSSDPFIGDYSTYSGCFFENVTNGLMINFDNNNATYGGSDLFGGLLDRCRVVNPENHFTLQPNGIVKLKDISNITSFETISSKPVRVCLCQNSVPDCNQQNYSIEIKDKNGFIVPIAAVDQVQHIVSATIHSKFKDVKVSESQTVQRINANCSNLEYQVSFPRVRENYELIIHAEGPCNNKGISTLNVSIYVDDCSCPPGFMPADRNTQCDCVCDRRYETFTKYIQECNATKGSIIRTGLFWITYLNRNNTYDDNISPYFIHPYCPLDYCQPPNKRIPINLSLPNGSDAQCENNRGGILCGGCLPNYSLSLGSSNCVKCPEHWYGHLIGIIIAAFFAGIMLVFLLLWLNLTVAVGTLNSIIFYANVINANRITYFSQSHLTFVPVFISWLNLDIGFDTCFFEGMDIYAKTWIHVAFPAYIIFLVVVIIFFSSRSSKFSNLIGKRNPVATLATLILLSYTKLLQTVITSFSFVNLKYPNGTTNLLWLPNANIAFANHKLELTILIILAIIILLIGMLYTVLIFSWQWLLHCPRSKLFKWTRNQKLHSFIDTYHTPNTAKHRYWTGMLLLVRVIVYLVAAFSSSSELPITLLSTVLLMCCLLLYKTVWTSRVYRNWILNTMESFMYFNIATFALFTLYTFNSSGYRDKRILQTLQIVSAYVSVGATLLLLVFVIIFHVYTYSTVSMKVYSMAGGYTKLSQMFNSHTSSISHTKDREFLSLSENVILDVIDSPRTVTHTTPFIDFKKVSNDSIVSPRSDSSPASTS